MDYENRLRELIKKHNGIILTKEVTQAGIPRQYLNLIVQKNELEHVARGVYLTRETFVDEIFCIQIRSNWIVFSHETALYMHDLTDREPLVYNVTVPRGYATNRLCESGINVVTVKKELYPIGIIAIKTIYGNEVQVYDMERTICDIIKNRNRIDKNMFYVGLKKYASSREKNLKLLMKYARELGMESQVKKHVEGLLV